MYKNILVPHAGTPAGDLALNHAIHIAKSSKAKITLLHVIEEFPHVPVFSLHASQASKIKKELAEIAKEMEIVLTRIEPTLNKQFQIVLC